MVSYQLLAQRPQISKKQAKFCTSNLFFGNEIVFVCGLHLLRCWMCVTWRWAQWSMPTMGNSSNLSFSLPAEHLAPLSASHCPAVALRSELENILIMMLARGPNVSLPLYLLPFRGAEVKVTVHYETSPSCTAVQWLQPAQTAGKIHPYLYTQCQVCTYREGNLLSEYHLCHFSDRNELL